LCHAAASDRDQPDLGTVDGVKGDWSLSPTKRTQLSVIRMKRMAAQSVRSMKNRLLLDSHYLPELEQSIAEFVAKYKMSPKLQGPRRPDLSDT
jgi:hypothetical protein